MPFSSKAQMRYLYSQHPEVAKEFTEEQKKEGKSFKNMPEHKDKFSKTKKMCMGGESGYATGGMVNPGQGSGQQNQAPQMNPLQDQHISGDSLAPEINQQDSLVNSLTNHIQSLAAQATGPDVGPKDSHQQQFGTSVSAMEQYANGGVVDNQHFDRWVDKPVETYSQGGMSGQNNFGLNGQGYAMGGPIMPPTQAMPMIPQQQALQQILAARQGMQRPMPTAPPTSQGLPPQAANVLKGQTMPPMPQQNQRLAKLQQMMKGKK